MIGNDRRLIKAAEQVSKDKKLLGEANTLVERFLAGNTNPGIDNNYLFDGISELRSRNGARVYFRMVNGKVDVLAISNKDNQKKVISALRDIYGK
jgi:hypothetical protein